jgi:stage II sporulation protein D
VTKIFLKKFLLFYIFCFFPLGNFYGFSKIKNHNEGSKIIRVLLNEYNTHEDIKFTFSSHDGFVLESPIGSGTTVAITDSTIFIRCVGGKIYIMCDGQQYRRLKYSELEICTPYNTPILNGRTYQGSLCLKIDDKTQELYVVNKLNLEDYIYSVLRYESIPSWPDEVQKVQAVASRTYALYHMYNARTKNKNSFYDIKNTIKNQLYNGVHSHTHLRQVVDETKGLILSYKNSIALTMFDVCCGGVYPALLRKKDLSKPYLYRKQKCDFCKDSSYYLKKEKILLSDFLSALKKNPKLSSKFKNFGNKLNDIYIIDKDKAGVVHKVRLAGRRYLILTGQDIKSSLQSKIKSMAFSLKKEGKYVGITCHGYHSHFNGLCQCGARALVKKGYSWKEILAFYYPETRLSRIV